jgi:hypothetical protein
MMLLKRYEGKPDIYSRTIRLICEVAMNGVGPYISFPSRSTKSILNVLMKYTGWNMVLVGKTQHMDVHTWSDVIELVVDSEMECDAPSVQNVLAGSDGVLVKFTNKSSNHKHIKDTLNDVSSMFHEYDSWGNTIFTPMVSS